MTYYQLILSGIALILVYTSGRDFIKARSLKFIPPTLISLGILSLSLFPTLTHYINEKLGLGENLNTLIFTGFIIIYAVIFRLFKSIEIVKRDITTIVQKQALNEFARDHEKRDKKN